MKFLFQIILFVFFLSQCGTNSCETKCSLIPEQGTCKALIPKYYFDNQDKECKEFIWGGCDGVVPFETLIECEECSCN